MYSDMRGIFDDKIEFTYGTIAPSSPASMVTLTHLLVTRTGAALLQTWRARAPARADRPFARQLLRLVATLDTGIRVGVASRGGSALV